MHLDICDIQAGSLPMLGQLARGIYSGFNKVISNLKKKFLHFFIQLLIGVHLSDQILQTSPGQNLMGIE